MTSSVESTPPSIRQKKFELNSPNSSPIFVSSLVTCIFCRSQRSDEVNLGELLTSDGIAVHYNCLLSASVLAQKVGDDEGIRGFTVSSIRHAARNAKKELCVFCNEMGAVVGCCHKKCNRFFHFTCGQDNKCITHFYGTFNSYCNEHADALDFTLQDSNSYCPICSEEFEAEERLFKAPCCPNVSHLQCMRNFTYNAGTYVLKCPFCFDKEAFVNCILNFSSIYIPTREPLFEDHDRMTMELDCCYPECLEPERCENNDTWSLIKCTLCGSRAMHVCCVNKLPNRHFVCPDCGDDDSWLHEYRVRLNIRETTGRIFKFQLSSLTTKMLGIFVRDPTKETVTKSGRCSKRYEEKRELRMQTSIVRLASSRNDKTASDSEDDDDDEENTEDGESNKDRPRNPKRTSSSFKRKRPDETELLPSKKQKTKKLVSKSDQPGQSSEPDKSSPPKTVLANIANIATNPGKQQPGDLLSKDVPTVQTEIESKAQKSKKRRTPATFGSKRKPKSSPRPANAEDKKIAESSGFFDQDVFADEVDYGTVIRPCQMLHVYRDDGEFFMTSNVKSSKCFKCNPNMAKSVEPPIDKQVASSKQFCVGEVSP